MKIYVDADPATVNTIRRESGRYHMTHGEYIDSVLCVLREVGERAEQGDVSARAMLARAGFHDLKHIRWSGTGNAT